MGYELKAGGYPIYRDDVLHLWVRAVDGDDANHGLDADHPLETMQAAYDRIPYLNPLTVIHVGPHTGDGYDHGSLGPLAMLNHVILIGDGGGDPLSDGFTELLASTAAVAGSDKTKIVTAGGMTVDAYQRRTVEILTGPAAGDRRTINGNSATEVEPCYDFSAAVAAGNTFRVVAPAIRFKYTNILDNTQGLPKPFVSGCGTCVAGHEASRDQGRVWLVNIQFYGTVRMNHLVFANSGMVWLGVDFEGSYSSPIFSLHSIVTSISSGFEVKAHRGVTSGIYPLVPAAVTLLGAPNTESWAGWATTNRYDSSFYFQGGAIRGWFVTTGLFQAGTLISQDSGASVVVEGGRITQWGVHAMWGGLVTLECIADNRPFKIKAAGWAIGAYEGGIINVAVYSPVQVDVPNGDGIFSNGTGSIVRILYDPVTGSASRYGMSVRNGGEIYIGYDVAPAITGAVGDIDWNNGADLKTNAQLVAGESFQSKYGRVLRY